MCIMPPVSPMGPAGTSTRSKASDLGERAPCQLPGIHIEPLSIQPPLDSPHPSSPFLPRAPYPRHPFHLPALGAFPCTCPSPSPALSGPRLRHHTVPGPGPCHAHTALLWPSHSPRHSPI